jgi:capsular polysaccharide export protein
MPPQAFSARPWLAVPGAARVDAARRVLAIAPATLRTVPHIAAFFPEHEALPVGRAPRGSLRLQFFGTRSTTRHTLVALESPWRAPRFGRRHAPVALLAAEAEAGGADPLRLALSGDAFDGAALAAGQRLLDLACEARVGGAPGLPDPGWRELALPYREAVVVLDPCDPAASAAAQAMLRAALASAGGRPVLVAAAPDARRTARPVLAPIGGARLLPGRLAPWTLLDLAATLYGLGTDVTELLALAAGIPLRTAEAAPWWGLDPAHAGAALAAAGRAADPYRGRPWPLERAIQQLADWRVREAEHRRIVACTGVEIFKRRRLAGMLAHEAGAPRMVWRGSAAVAEARRRSGGIAVWAAGMRPGLAARCAEAGIVVTRMEDGFVRSAGLGVHLAPAASLVLDGGGIHFAPTPPSDIETLLATAVFRPALLDRAKALWAALVAHGLTKYNLDGAVPSLDLPCGRRVILVVGQVEDDASVLRNGGAIRRNLDLLCAVRQAAPAATILYKPHPDVESGMRRGVVPTRAALRLADRVLERVPIGALYAQVQELHCISSLAGFEALLRGIRVVTWGRPFYAGWGLTEDRDPGKPKPPLPGARRRRWDPGFGGPQLTLEALIAAALILYPRYWDPRTGLPCAPELVLERLGEAGLPGRANGGLVPRVPMPLRALVARTSRLMTNWLADR